MHPIRILHEAVALGEIAETGPLLPCLSNLEAADRAATLKATCTLKQFCL